MLGKAYCEILGTVTKDPESKTTSGGNSLCTFSVAVNERRGENETVSYFDVEAWNKVGEIVQNNCKKGDNLSLRCKMKQDRFEQEVGGETVKRSKVRLSLMDINFCGGGKKDE